MKKPKRSPLIMGLNTQYQVFGDRRTKRERDRSTKNRKEIRRSLEGS